MNIFELEGIFSEPWLKRSGLEMSSVLEKCPSRGLLFNLCSVERVDQPGAQLILETARKAAKGGILGQNLSSYYVAEHMNPNELIPIFETEVEAVEHFGNELAQNGEGSNRRREERLFPRIKTALPVVLEFKEGATLCKIEAVVLNLSEGGLYARFLNSKAEGLALRTLDPFDLKMLTLRLILPGDPMIKMDGKILRADRQADSGELAVEFYNLGNADQQKIRSFLDGQSAE